ncbi:MAG TPA: c-type cytochrome biogenesis protein CcmI [Gammaproteobacteria bacterium]|nr:c-type cytochrome biogenesis protein CcmI [Gammaproteobacteria bacterium]
MTVFWIIAGVMASLALAFLLVPLLRQRGPVDSHPESAELSVHRQRLHELHDEFGRGTLTEAQFESAKRELAAAAAVDLTPALNPARQFRRHWALAGSITVVLPVFALSVYEFLGARQEVTLQLTADQEAELQARPLRQSIERLEARLAAEPNDGEGWRLLGRSYLALGEYTQAVNALSRAHTLLAEDPELLLDYAQALAQSQGDRLQGAPTQLIRRTLTLAPEHPRALWLGAVAALQEGTRAEAKDYLERLVPHIEPGSEAEQLVRAQLAELQETPDSGKREEATAAVSPQPRVEIQVSLDPKLAANVSPTDTVFIFARAVQGPPMPLAVVRKHVKDLPVTVVLDDSKAMAPELRLSKFTEVVVGARVSRAGDPLPRSGDLEGFSNSAIKLADLLSIQPVIISIDRVVP